jgi:Ni,Fe-hydrogenase I cytochrome b subunit
MFDSLADRMREDAHQEVKTSERIIRWIVIAVLSVLLFGGLYMGIRLLEG